MKIIIIGAGPGGCDTAVEAASRGIETILINGGKLGGTCLNEGCIPTKTLCALDSPDPGRKEAVISRLHSGIETLLRHKLITTVNGKARLLSPTSVEVEGVSYSADALIIATGSVSASLPVSGAELAFDSSKMLESDEVPSRLCVIGGGVIGLEFASIYKRFGSEVTVLEYCPNILPRFDTDLSKRLKASLARRGIKIETSAEVTAISEQSVSFTKKGASFEVPADRVLMAVGRRPALGSLNLDKLGIAYTPKGITVDSEMRTSVPGIYAIGDITGGMMLAHTATAQGRKALDAICGIPCTIDMETVPSTVFTTPEAASAGLSEEACEGREIITGKASYAANGKAVASACDEGWCKVIAEAGTGRILGVHILGAHAADLIHEAAVLISLGATLKQACGIIHAHPTLSEVLAAALRDCASKL